MAEPLTSFVLARISVLMQGWTATATTHLTIQLLTRTMCACYCACCSCLHLPTLFFIILCHLPFSRAITTKRKASTHAHAHTYTHTLTHSLCAVQHSSLSSARGKSRIDLTGTAFVLNATAADWRATAQDATKEIRLSASGKVADVTCGGSSDCGGTSLLVTAMHGRGASCFGLNR